MPRVWTLYPSVLARIPGMDWGFTYQLVDDGGHALHAPCACKEYLTDIMWAESTNTAIRTSYGLQWEPGLLPKTNEYHLALRDGAKSVSACRSGLQTFLNWIEAPAGIDLSTVEEDTTGTSLISSFSAAWTKKPYLISAYTQLLRLGMRYTEGDPLLFLKTLRHQSMDGYRLPVILPRLMAIREGRSWPQRYEDYRGVDEVHSAGGLFSWRSFVL